MLCATAPELGFGVRALNDAYLATRRRRRPRRRSARRGTGRGRERAAAGARAPAGELPRVGRRRDAPPRRAHAHRGRAQHQPLRLPAVDPRRRRADHRAAHEPRPARGPGEPDRARDLDPRRTRRRPRPRALRVRASRRSPSRSSARAATSPGAPAPDATPAHRPARRRRQAISTSAIWTAFNAAPLRRLSPVTQRSIVFAWLGSSRSRPDEHRVDAGALERGRRAGTTVDEHHARARRRAARRPAPRSSRRGTARWRDIAWPTNTGTRTHVAVMRIVSSWRILRLSYTSFHSSLV